MRLDKYLKVSRLIKRRTVAQEACDGSRVCVNGKPQKPAYTVKVGDIITIGFGDKALTVRVTSIQEYAKKEDASSLFEVI